MIRSKDEPAIAEFDVPVVELSYDVPMSTKARHTVVSSPTRDVGLTSGPPQRQSEPWDLSDLQWACSN